MNKVMRFALISFSLVLLTLASFAYVLLEPNPLKWGEGGRVLFVILCALWLWVSCMTAVMNNDNNYKDNDNNLYP